MTRLTLTLGHDGMLRLHHDAGHNVTVLLVERAADGELEPAGRESVKAIPTSTETDLGRVAYNLHDRQYRLESEL